MNNPDLVEYHDRYMTLEQVERELEVIDTRMKRLNRDLGAARTRAEALARKKEQILAESVDDWPNGTYLIVHHPGWPSAPFLYWKDDSGRWWTHPGGQTSWDSVRRVLEIRNDTWQVTAMQQVLDG